MEQGYCDTQESRRVGWEGWSENMREESYLREEGREGAIWGGGVSQNGRSQATILALEAGRCSHSTTSYSSSPPFLQPGELKGNNGEIPTTVFDCKGGGAPPKSANFSKENVQPFKGGGGIPPSLLEKFTQHGVLGWEIPKRETFVPFDLDLMGSNSCSGCKRRYRVFLAPLAVLL